MNAPQHSTGQSGTCKWNKMNSQLPKLMFCKIPYLFLTLLPMSNLVPYPVTAQLWDQSDTKDMKAFL